MMVKGVHQDVVDEVDEVVWPPPQPGPPSCKVAQAQSVEIKAKTLCS